MKTLPWFRMYSDFIHDEMVEMLAFEDQRHFVFLLCMKNAGSLDKDYPSPEMIDVVVGRRLGIHGEALSNAKIRLMKVGLIDAKWQPTGWDKRQFVSDANPTNAERQKRYRDAHKNTVTDSNVTRNVTVTLTDTDTDTDTDKDKKSVSAQAPTKPVKPAAFALPDWVDANHWDAWRSHPKLKNATDKQKAIAVEKLAKWREAGEDFAGALENAAASGYQGLFLPDSKNKSSAQASPAFSGGF